MKNLVFFICITLCSVVQGQEETMLSNTTFLGGGITFNSQSNGSTFQSINGQVFLINNGVSSSSFSIQPYFGKRLSSSFDLGFNPSYTSTTSTSIRSFFNGSTFIEEEIESSLNTFGANIFGRNILNPNSDLKVFIRSSIGYFFTTGDIEFNSFTIAVSPGLMYDVNSSFRVLANLRGIDYTNVSAEGEESISQFNAVFSLANLFFGLEYKF